MLSVLLKNINARTFCLAEIKLSFSCEKIRSQKFASHESIRQMEILLNTDEILTDRVYM